MPEPIRELVLLVNSKSRSGSSGLEAAKTALESEGFVVKASHMISDAKEFSRILSGYLSNAEPLIAIGGGDGTQRMAAEMFAGFSSAMLVFPMGTGNAWAKDLGIPVGASHTAKALATANIESIDLGVANGRGFVNVATVGLTSLIVKNLTKSR